MTHVSQRIFPCSDRDLLRMLRRKEDYAFELLYKKYWDPLLHFAAQYLEDEDSCKEVVQNLFVHLHSRYDSLIIRSSVSSYLFASLRNRISNYFRNRRVYQKHLMLAGSVMPSALNNVEQLINLAELEKEIAKSLEKMPSKCKEVYVLHKQNHFTIKKISCVLNRPVDTIEKQLRKAMSLIRSQLKLVKMDPPR